MTPLTEAVTELRLVVERAEKRADAGEPTHPEDRRTECIGELCDALDRVDPFLGTRLLAALYVHVGATR